MEIEAGIKTTHYPKWLTRQGKPRVVVPIKFLGYNTNQVNRTTRTYYLNNRPYLAERWLCIIDETTGDKQELLFPVEKATYDEVGWDYNKNPIDDEQCNTHFDKWEYDGENYHRLYEEQVVTDSEKATIEALEYIVNTTENNIIGRLAQLKMMMLQSPTMLIKRDLEKLIKNHPEENTLLSQLLK